MDKEKLSQLQKSLMSDIPDISKLAEYREKEEWVKARAKAAAKCQEVVEISRAMIIEHPDLDIGEAIVRAREFYEQATTFVDEIMEEFEEEPNSSPLVA